MKFVIVGSLILLDLLTGVVKAFKENNFNSSVMREGLYHKCGSVIVIALAVLMDYGQTVLNFGVSVPLTISACTYIGLMEFGSIYENACLINPELSTENLRNHFEKLKNGKG